jgi:hypothetical protein
LKIAAEKVGYGWIVSRRTSSGHLGADRERKLADQLTCLGADRHGSGDDPPPHVGGELEQPRTTLTRVERNSGGTVSSSCSHATSEQSANS